MSKIHTHYDNLKISRDASDAVIEAAYKALMNKYRPDKYQGSTEEAYRIIKVVKQAYDVLINPQKRAEYDKWITVQETKLDQEEVHFSEVGEATEQHLYSSEVISRPTQNFSKEKSNDSIPNLAGAWRRFFARFFDIWWENTTLGTLLIIILSKLSFTFSEVANIPYFGAFFAIISLPLALVMDAYIYHLFGNTPGKYLLGLAVKKKNNNNLEFDQYLNRNFSLWKKALAFGLPIVYLVTMLRQKNIFEKHKQTDYDKLFESYVVHNSTGWMKSIIFVFLFFSLFSIQSLIDYYDKMQMHAQIDKIANNSNKEPIRHKEITSANPLLKEYFIKSLYDSCYDNFEKENPNSLSEYSKKNYCECYVQDISQKLTTEDIESFYKPGDYKPSIYLQIIINHVSKECMKNEINKKLN